MLRMTTNQVVCDCGAAVDKMQEKCEVWHGNPYVDRRSPSPCVSLLRFIA